MDVLSVDEVPSKDTLGNKEMYVWETTKVLQASPNIQISSVSVDLGRRPDRQTWRVSRWPALSESGF